MRFRLVLWGLITLAAVAIALALTFKAEATAVTEVEGEPPQCVTFDEMRARLAISVRQMGGIGGMIESRVAAQAFSDSARAFAGKPGARVTAVLFWFYGPVAIAEIGADGCLAAMYPIDPETFKAAVEAMPRAPPD